MESSVIDEILRPSSDKGLTQAELARRSGIHPTSLSRIISKGQARLDTIEALARTLGLRLALLPDNDLVRRLIRRSVLMARYPDKYGVIWTTAAGEPAKLADTVLSDTSLRITKTDAAAELGLPGVSMLHDLASLRQIEYQRQDSQRLPPQLQALLPPKDQANPQRAILGRLLARQINVAGMDPLDQEWHLLTFAGHGGVGHLDVFKSDELASEYYRNQASYSIQQATGSGLWGAFKRIAAKTATEQDEELVIDAVGPTPAVSGSVPKLLVPITIGDHGWDGSFGGPNSLPAVVKLESYPGLVELEHLAYEYARRTNICTPRTWKVNIAHRGEVLRLLAVERYDRVLRRAVPVESMFALLRTGNPRRYWSSTDGTMEKLGEVLAVGGLLSDPIRAKKELFERFVFSVLTGNGDMHSENVALVGPAGAAEMSPHFDPAPMRAYRYFRRNHNMLSALSFAGIGGHYELGEVDYNDYSDGTKTPADLGTKLVEFGSAIGLPFSHCVDTVALLGDQTEGYIDEAAAALHSIPLGERKPFQPDIDGFLKTLMDVRYAAINGLRSARRLIRRKPGPR